MRRLTLALGIVLSVACVAVGMPAVASAATPSTTRHATATADSATTLAPQAAATAGGPVVRVAGTTRYDTAARVAATRFGAGVDVAFVASGQNFPDALAGGPVAAAQHGPVLLTAPGSLPPVTADALTKLRPKTIVVLGGTAAVAPSVEQSLARYTTGAVTRIAGTTRYDTAARVAASQFRSGVGVAYIASGQNFPDALAGGPVAAAQDGPVLLTAAGSLPPVTASELAKLHPGRIVVLGGTTAVAPSVATALQRYTTGKVTRIAGTTRYDTAAKVSASAFEPGADVVYLASGQNFPDALAGGPVAAALGAPMLLTAPGSVPGPTATELARLDPKRIVVLGGVASVTDDVATALAGYQSPQPVTGVRATATATGQVTLSWTNPTSGGMTGVVVRRATGSTAPTSASSGTTVAVTGATPTSAIDAHAIAGAQYSYAVFTQNAAGHLAQRAVATVTMPATVALRIAAPSLPTGVDGAQYLGSVTATGGTAPYTWTAAGLPAGLTMSADGQMGGVPAHTGTTKPTFTVKDATGLTASTTGTISVPTALPTECDAATCADLTPTARTQQIPADRIVSVGLDGTGAIASAVLTGATVATGDVLVLAPTDQIPSGAIGTVTRTTAGTGGQTSVTLTPGTLADAYSSGTLHAVTPIIEPAPSSSSLAPQATSPISCTGGASAQTTTLAVTPKVTGQLLASWEGGGGSVAGLSMFQVNLDAGITLSSGVSVSGSGKCTLTAPPITAEVPAGPAGVVVFALQPSVSFSVSGKAELGVSVNYTCATQYQWYRGTSTSVKHCTPTAQPLEFAADTGVAAKLAANLGVSATLDGMIGVAGDISPSLTAAYTPTTHPIATISAQVDADMTACVVCFFDGGLAKLTMYSGTIWGPKVLASYDTASSIRGRPVVTTTTLVDAQQNTGYRATLTTADNRGGSWTVSGLPSGLSRSANTIVGTPKVSGRFPITIGFTDSTGAKASATATLQVWPSAPAQVVPPISPTRAASVSTTAFTACAVTTAGGVVCSGSNGGMFGDGGTADASTPVAIPALSSGIRDVVLGNGYACAVTTAGGALCWGNNDTGQLGNGTTTSSLVPVQVTGLTTGVRRIVLSRDDTCAVMTSGGVRCWGSNVYNVLGDGGSEELSTVPTAVVGLSGPVQDLYLADANACVLTTNGGVQCWGYGSSWLLGQNNNTSSGVPVTPKGLGSGVRSLGMQDYAACAVTDAGRALCWGSSEYGKLGTGNSVGVVAGVPTQVYGLSTGVAEVIVGPSRSCALMESGAVSCWGQNTTNTSTGIYGPEDSFVPVPVKGLPADISQVVLGPGYSAAITSDGSVWEWPRAYNPNVVQTDPVWDVAHQRTGLPTATSSVVVTPAQNEFFLEADGRLLGVGSGSLGLGPGIGFQSDPVGALGLGG